MMNVKLFIVAQGMCVAELINEDRHGFSVRNPVFVSQKTQQEVMLIPVLYMAEENCAMIPKKDVFFGGAFTPKTEIVNHYNRLFGSGIVIPDPRGNVLQF